MINTQLNLQSIKNKFNTCFSVKVLPAVNNVRICRTSQQTELGKQ